MPIHIFYAYEGLPPVIESKSTVFWGFQGIIQQSSCQFYICDGFELLRESSIKKDKVLLDYFIINFTWQRLSSYYVSISL